jgi:cation-transporting P-type ATPase 13A2
VGTILVTLSITVYMILGPAQAIKKLMQLTKTSWDFELMLLFFGVMYLALSWSSEKFVFPGLARLFGRVKQKLTGSPKQRKEYKIIEESMRI